MFQAQKIYFGITERGEVYKTNIKEKVGFGRLYKNEARGINIERNFKTDGRIL